MEFSLGFYILLSLCCAYVGGFLYQNTSHWILENEQCDECAQSPIHVVFNYAEVVQLPALVLNNYGKADVVRVSNKGDTVMITPNAYLNATVTGGHHVGTHYQVESVVFHWGADGALGSEHKVDFRRYAVEMQIVHRNMRYSSVADAMFGVNGFLIFAIFLDDVMNDNSVPQGLKSLCSVLNMVEDFGTSTTLDDFVLESLFTNLDMDRYYEYCGSLTKPPCTPNAVWMVFPHALEIPYKCLQKLRTLRNGSHQNITNNFRPLQPIMNRKIFYQMTRPWG